MAYCLYAACCSRQGGIAVLDGTEEGTLSLRQMATADRPMYMAMDGGKLLTLLLAPEGCGGDSALTAFPQEKDGRLRPHGELRSTGGVEACHLAARGGRVWCANYGTGSAALLEGETRRLAVFEGQGPHRDRQEAAHIHQVAFTPDGEFLAAGEVSRASDRAGPTGGDAAGGKLSRRHPRQPGRPPCVRVQSGGRRDYGV